jgi:hypothetical protein
MLNSGTPNSATTSLSALSTTAIKDGHRGAPLPGHHGHHLSTNTLEAERADRISRLAGLERVATARQGQAAGVPYTQTPPIPGYFDAQGNPVYAPKMSTVGSASATGSVGGRTTTWASGSQKGMNEGEGEGEGDDEDEMSMDTNYRDIDERDRYSTMDQSEDGDGMSDEGNASLVGFGEGAGSTVSGPTYTRSRQVVGSGLASEQKGSSADTAEKIVRERLDDLGEGRPALGTPDEAGLGKFFFEKK